ncbi:hypothetical protein Y1Q_0022640 [Alligator mississippiensis]|uniref:Uncharacterized protein n=1 Tax=Alligator mississippiensis TaxID=8496 RepID=A0A151PHD8_ALLMI|nr:hypothetical protein Y1Q_0022640 [Alligator mississippiensis]
MHSNKDQLLLSSLSGESSLLAIFQQGLPDHWPIGIISYGELPYCRKSPSSFLMVSDITKHKSDGMSLPQALCHLVLQ